jgi:hypothetical protein
LLDADSPRGEVALGQRHSRIVAGGPRRHRRDERHAGDSRDSAHESSPRSKERAARGKGRADERRPRHGVRDRERSERESGERDSRERAEGRPRGGALRPRAARRVGDRDEQKGRRRSDRSAEESDAHEQELERGVHDPGELGNRLDRLEEGDGKPVEARDPRDRGGPGEREHRGGRALAGDSRTPVGDRTRCEGAEREPRRERHARHREPGELVAESEPERPRREKRERRDGEGHRRRGHADAHRGAGLVTFVIASRGPHGEERPDEYENRAAGVGELGRATLELEQIGGERPGSGS